MKTILITILGAILLGWLLFQPSTISRGQDSTKGQATSIESLKAKGERLDIKQDKQIERLANIVSEPTEKTRIIYKIKRVPVSVPKPVLASEQKILLRVNGKLIYETDPELYKGNVMIDIDLDSLNRDMQIEESLVDILVPVPDTVKKKIDNRSGLQKVIDRVNPFKKKN